MATRNQRIAAGQFTNAPDIAIYTVPSINNLILKQLWAEITSAPSSLSIYLLIPGLVQVPLLVATDLAVNETFRFDGWVVLNPGDRISMSVTPGTVSYWASGALLPLTSQT